MAQGRQLSWLALPALLALAVGGSTEPSMVGMGDAMDGYAGDVDDSEGMSLGDAKDEDEDEPDRSPPKPKKDKDGQEPGDGSDPPPGGSEEEDEGAPAEEEPPDLSPFLARSTRVRRQGPWCPP